MPGCHWFIALEVEDRYFCDLFETQGEREAENATGSCIERRGESHTYDVAVPVYKQDTWYDLGYHMYFHTRETPGLRLVWNRDLSAGELELLEENLRCSYELEQGGRVHGGHLEGVRVDPEGAWCFDYLGTMLVKFQKEHGAEDARPDAGFFPVVLRLKYRSEDPPLNGEASGRIVVRWDSGKPGAEKKSSN